MPGLMEVLGVALGGDVQRQLGQQIGADSKTTSNAIQAALPMLLSGLHQNASQPGGAAVLLGALQRDHDGSMLDDIGGLLGGNLAGRASNGAGILGHLLGDRQETAQMMVAKTSGLDAGQAAKMMMAIAPIVMGALGRMQRSQGLDANGLASMLQGEHSSVTKSQPQLMDMAGRLFDRNSEGAGADDLMKGLGSLLGGR